MKNPKNKNNKTIYFNCSECGNKKPCINPPLILDEQRNELFCSNTGIVFSKEEFKKRIIKNPKKRNINLY